MSIATLDTATVRCWKRYPEYRQAVMRDARSPLKDSGALYWGEIPSHWGMTKLRHLVPDHRQIMYGIVLPGPHVDDGVPIVKGGNCEPGRLRLEFISRTSREIESGYERSRLRAGDIVYAIRGSIGAAEIVPEELTGANLTQDAARIAPKPGVHVRWLLYAVRSSPFFAKLDAGATGATIRGINIRDLKRADLPLPPFSEQELIAAFLDRETARIDALIGHKERLIALLEEKRQTVISHAVTRTPDGFDWPLIKLSRLLRGNPKNGISPPISPDGGVVSFSIAAVRNGRVNINEHIKYADLTPEEARPYEVRAGDVLVMRGSGSLSFVGTCGIVTDHPTGCVYPDILIRLRVGSKLRSEFLVLALNSLVSRQQVEVVAQTANGTWKISGQDLKGIRIPNPPADQQNEIIHLIGQRTRSLDEAAGRVRDGIERLQEYRTSLISAAVTGQIDVRGEV